MIINDELPFCKCGCGNRVSKPSNNYIHGHYCRGRKKEESHKLKLRNAHLGKKATKETKLKMSKSMKKYFSNEEARLKKSEDMKKAYSNDDIRKRQKENTPRGEKHHFYRNGIFKGKHHTEETKIKMKESQLGEKHHFYGKHHKKSSKDKTSKSMKKWWNETIEGKNQKRTQQEKMNNGQAAYCNSFITNPSKPQVELFELTRSLYNTAILNHPCLNFAIDIAIPDLNVAIECDGKWHKHHEEADSKRQKLLEDEGWIFLRYMDYIPSKEELKENISLIICQSERKNEIKINV